MNKLELAKKIRKNGESIFLSFQDAFHMQWLNGIYGGEENVQKKLPILESAWKATVSQPPSDEPYSEGFIDDNSINTIHWVMENHTLIIEATTSLTEVATFIDEHMEVRTADGTIIAVFTQSTIGVNHTTFTLKTEFDPKAFPSDILEIDFTSNWAVASTGLLKASLNSRDIHTEVLLSNTIKDVRIFQPIKKDSYNPFPINICYNRIPTRKEDIDYIYDGQFDPETRQQRLFAPLSAWVRFTDDSDPFVEIDISTFSLKMDCQNGIVKYTKANRESLIKNFFCKGPNRAPSYINGIFFEIDPNWLANTPSSKLPKRDRIDIFFSVEYICKSGKRGIIQISSNANESTPACIGKAGWLNILWGCLAKGTKITMADGRLRPIEDLRIGDSIANEKGYTVEVEYIVTGVEHEPLIVLQTTSQKTLSCSYDHPVMTTNGMLKAGELTGEHTIFGEYGELLKIDGIWSDYEENTVYNILVPGNRFYANGILVGDFTEQGMLMTTKQTLRITKENPVFSECETKYEIWKQVNKR